MLKSMLLVGAGSFVGGALRYLLSVLVKGSCGASFPWATLAVNLIGCFVIGVVYALFARYASTSYAMCLLLATGLCGGFTTFSAFANEGLQMLQSGSVGAFAAYLLASVAGGVALTAAGYCVIRIV